MAPITEKEMDGSMANGMEMGLYWGCMRGLRSRDFEVPYTMITQGI